MIQPAGHKIVTHQSMNNPSMDNVTRPIGDGFMHKEGKTSSHKKT